MRYMISIEHRRMSAGALGPRIEGAVGNRSQRIGTIDGRVGLRDMPRLFDRSAGHSTALELDRPGTHWHFRPA